MDGCVRVSYPPCPRVHGSVISPRTRAIVVNTPHNPTGKVFSRQELEAIADVVRENPRVSREGQNRAGTGVAAF